MIGGNLAGQANQLVNLRFSRRAEAEADADARAALIRADISPRPTAKALRALAAHEGGLPACLSDHPASADRADRFYAALRPGPGGGSPSPAEAHRRAVVIAAVALVEGPADQREPTEGLA